MATPEWEKEERRPRNALERLIWLHGRAFYLCFFAGLACLFAFVVSTWAVARVPSIDHARLLKDFAVDFFFYVTAIVSIFSGKNVLNERFHGKTETPATGRRSGAMGASPTEEGR